MSGDGLTQAKRILFDALEFEDRDRAAFLRDRCAGDAALRAEVRELLGRAARTADLLEAPEREAPPPSKILTVAGGVATGRQDPAGAVAWPGARLGVGGSRQDLSRIGPFRLLELLGEGGMGRVYLAEQTEPVERRVALKLMHRSLMRPDAVARFVTERQAMARLTHPQIAQMLEAGTTEEGFPFLVMEYVDGVPVTKYCDQEQLNIEARLRLFCDICGGVQHAHLNQILHRDLKPSNVLAFTIDGQPSVKVIDFGIAKALDDSLGSAAVTGRHVIGTPGYMSPEALQAGIDGPAIDIRADVYSLGVLLYKILTGGLPYSTAGLGPRGLRSRIESQPPSKPSTRVSSLDGDRAVQVAARRRSDPGALRSRLRGDLDWIVLKAIACRREDRYQSCAELAADVRRHLRHQPVEARPPSPGYLFGRWVRRHRAPAAAAALLLLALVAGLVARSLEARRANRAAAEARANLAEAQDVSKFLSDLFATADPTRAQELGSARDILDRGAERIRSGLGERPLARARFAAVLGNIYTELGDYSLAEELVDLALELRRAELPPTHPAVADNLGQLGVIYRHQGRLDEAGAALQQTVEALDSAPEGDRLHLAQTLNNLGNVRWQQLRHTEAEAAYRRALALKEQVLGSEDADVGLSLNNLGSLFLDQKKLDQAEEAWRRSAEILSRAKGDRHPWVAAPLLNLSGRAKARGDWQQSDALLHRAMDIWEDSYGPDHPRTLSARARWVNSLSLRKRWAEAVAARRQLIELLVGRFGPRHSRVRFAFQWLGRDLAQMGDHVGAVESLYRAQAIYRQLAGGAPGAEAPNEGTDNGSAQGLSDFGQAEVLYRGQLERHRRDLGGDHEVVVLGTAWWAWLLQLRGRLEEAEALHRQVLEQRRELLEPDDMGIGWSLYFLGRLVAARGRDAEAERLLRRALEIRQQELGRWSLSVADTLHDLGLAVSRQGRDAEARGLLQRALEIRRKTLRPDHPELRANREALDSLGPA